MINEGKWEINGRVFELLTLDEEAVVSASIGAVEVYRFGDYVTFYLANAQVEGEAFNVRFYFCKGQITDVELHLLRDYGPEWKGKVWEESFLEMLAQGNRSAGDPCSRWSHRGISATRGEIARALGRAGA